MDPPPPPATQYLPEVSKPLGVGAEVGPAPPNAIAESGFLNVDGI